MKPKTCLGIAVIVLLAVSIPHALEAQRGGPEEGWCCRHGEVFRASEPVCREEGGRFFQRPEEAEEMCASRERQRPEGWCCRRAEVFAAREPECLETGGSFFHRPEEAEEACSAREGRREEGWCCLRGEVFPAPERECRERGGSPFASEREAVGRCREAEEVRIPDLKGDRWQHFVGRVVTVTGVFVRDPVPMLVTDLELVLVNKPIPESEHVVLVGPIAEELEPAELGGAELEVSGRVVVADETDDLVAIYGGDGRTRVMLELISVDLLSRIRPYQPAVVTVSLVPGPAQPRRFAILFSGGISAKSNYVRYWNDLKFMYSALLSNGFAAKNIAVLYADGKARDQQMPVHYSGTLANLQAVFNLLRNESTGLDLVFLFITNHGGGFDKTSKVYFDQSGGRLDAGGDEGAETISEAAYQKDFNGNGSASDQVAWDESLFSWGGEIVDDALANAMQGLTLDRMVVVMEQCFSAGLIRDVALTGGNIVLLSAAGQYEPSWAMPPKYDYDEFSYHFTCAINGATPDGKTVDADTDKDGHVSMVEAFNYARSKDSRPETPWYEDNGDGTPHSGAMPSSGEGQLGSNTTLD